MTTAKAGTLWYEITGDTKGLVDAERRAKRSVETVGSEFDRLQTRVTKVSAAISAALATIAIDGLVSKVVNATRQFDVMFASLKTMTGGVQQASAAWERLEKFASQTPFSLEQSVRGFTKLKALGLDPSERALTSFGNTASAMGKSLDQMIEAVADASTGEFERLKEFGIKAKQEGDRVSLTFQGVTTTIGNNSREITEYLTKIGEVEFAGAMSERMKTLDGDISNLEDSLAGLYRSIGQSGFGDAIAQGVRMATQAIQEATASVKQGELTEYFDRLRPVIAGAEIAAVTLAGAIAGRLVTAMAASVAQAYATATAMGVATGATRTFGTVVAALGGPVGIAITALIALALNWEKVAGEARDAATISEQAADRIAKALKRSPGKATEDLAAQLRDVQDELRLIDRELGRTGANMASPQDLQELRQRRDVLVKVAADIGKAMDTLHGGAGRGKITPELVPMSKLEGGTPAPSPAPAPKGKREIGYAITDPIQEQTQRFLQSEKAAYDQIAEWERDQAQEAERNAARRVEAQRRGRILAEDTIAGGDEVDRLRLDMERRSALLQEFATIDQENAKLYADAQVALEEQTSERIRVILQKRHDEQLALQQQQLTAYGNVFGSMADLVKTFGGEQSKAYKVLFAASKAFAIASSIVSIQKAYADAWATGATLPQKIAAVATIASQTAGIVATIKGTNYGGGRQYGGPVASGSLYRVNETGRPEMFTAANGSQFMLPTSSGRVTAADQVGGRPSIKVEIVNTGTPQQVVSQSYDDDERILRLVTADIAGQIANNRGPVWRAMTGASNVRARQG